MAKIIFLKIEYLLLVISLYSCATIFKNYKTEFNVLSHPSDAKVFIKDSLIGTTPLKTIVESTHPLQIRIEKEGFQPLDTIIDNYVNTWWILFDLTIYPIGWIVDASNLSWYNFRDTNLIVELTLINNDSFKIIKSAIKHELANNMIYAEGMIVGQKGTAAGGAFINYENLLTKIFSLRLGFGFAGPSSSSLKILQKEAYINSFLMTMSLMSGSERSKFSFELGIAKVDKSILPYITVGYKYIPTINGLFAKFFIGFPSGLSVGYAF